MRRHSILLVSMPWASTVRPSLAIGILLSNLKRANIQASSLYPNLSFSSLITPDFYELIAESPSLFPVAEHLFATDLFGKNILNSDDYLQTTFTLLNDKERLLAPVFRMRDEIVPSFLKYYADAIIAMDHDVVGFSCTFNQVLPSLALAGRLKQLNPSIRILFGGACVHDEMGKEYARAFPDLIDAVFTGESDDVLVEYMSDADNIERISALPGVTCKGKYAHRAVPFDNLNENAVPDYDDYFDERTKLLSLNARLAPFKNLPFESSRGCWWGMKNHCTFCGLNNLGMAYRRKNPDKIVEELLELASRYKCVNFFAADNILDFKSYNNLLPKIAELGIDLNLFYEIKANIKKKDIQLLKHAGIHFVQPGIESFSENTLKLMKKGVSPLQNIEFIKWAMEYNIGVIYNVLIGFHGETEDDYLESINYIKKIMHLPPPSGPASMVEVHRFSPMFYSPVDFGIEKLTPYAYMKNLYPRKSVDYKKISYYFNNSMSLNDDQKEKIAALNTSIQHWIDFHEPRHGVLGNGFIDIIVNDECAQTIVEPIELLLYIITDAMITLSTIGKIAGKYGFTAEECGLGLDRLTEAGIVISDSTAYLNVVPYKVPKSTDELLLWFEKYVRVLLPAM